MQFSFLQNFKLQVIRTNNSIQTTKQNAWRISRWMPRGDTCFERLQLVCTDPYTTKREAPSLPQFCFVELKASRKFVLCLKVFDSNLFSPLLASVCEEVHEALRAVN